MGKVLEVSEKRVPLHRNRETKVVYRNVAQLVAHYVRDVGVGRSSRLIPTKTNDAKFAQMAESVDALVSNTSGVTSIPVRPRVWVLRRS